MDQLLGYLATILFTLMIVPQMIKTLQTQSIEGVSILLFIMNLVANIIALWYAILIFQPPLQIKYVLAIITTSIYIIIYSKIALRKRR